jgi:hypothetical protein
LSMEAALSYIARSWSVVPIPPKSKAPKIPAWQNLRIDAEAVPSYFSPGMNVGVLLGEPSGWLIDIDLDHPLARELAQKYLPPTPAVFGRPGSPGSHWLYRAKAPTHKRTSKHGMLVELRSTGLQTVFPGSVHTSGEPIEWESDGEPASVDAGELIAAVDDLADEVERRLRPLPRIENDSHRAAAYVRTIPSASEGCRNDEAFRVAAILVNDFALDECEAWRILAEWNSGNLPPLLEDELRKVLASAQKNAKHPKGEKLVEASLSPVDLTKIVSPVVVSCAFPVNGLEVEGLIGDIVAYNLETAIYPLPDLALAGALSLMSVITGRKVTDERNTRTNTYILGLAESGAGKEHARGVNTEILLRAGGEKLLGPESIGSSAGLIAHLSENPAMLFQLDEIGMLLSTMKSPGKAAHLYNIGKELMKLYSCSHKLFIGDAYADLKKTKRINQPHACVYGTCPPEQFWAVLTKENVSDGLLGRLMVFESPGYVMPKSARFQQAPEHIVDQVRFWLEFQGLTRGNLDSDPVEIKYTSDAAERFTDHELNIAKKRISEPKEHAAIWSRAAEKTRKLALLFACSRASGSLLPRVELGDVNKAIAISNWLARKMLRQVFSYVSDNETEASRKRVLRLIPGDGISLLELNRKTGWLRGRERRDILSDLQEAGLVVVEVLEPTGGRPKTIIRSMT